jgi:hypothetical protein
MHRLTPKTLLAAAALSALPAVLPSCATNDSMMFIIGVYARKSGSCEPKPEAESPLWASGRLDRQLAASYRAALLIGNQLTERGSREQVRTETSRVTLRGAEIRLETPEGVQLREPYSTVGTGHLDAASGEEPALSIMYADLIPASVAAKIPAGLVVANVRVFGDTLGGQEVESSELSFPIEVCDGCLIDYPASARDPAAEGNVYVCRLSEDSAQAQEAGELPCRPGVDLPVPCTYCSGVLAICQGPSENCFYNSAVECPVLGG